MTEMNMNYYNYKKVRVYMGENLEDNRDKITGELNHTKLAEDAFWHFEFSEEYFEDLCELATEFE